ncbi:phosphatidylserine decarboxylase-domain-containing protein [Cladochytrium replicatum]|nr:phosphatidylserine decarboxylase-domain-containing protein [Cladochytrium replicatum]
MRDAWVNTPIQWAPIPIGLGLSFLALLQLLHMFQRDLPGIAQKQTVVPDVSVVGPWQIHVYATLPLRSLSRVWGELNNLTVPMWLREPLYSSYAYLFDCNIEEAKVPDYKAYRNLGEFFYRELKDGVRPIDWSAAVVSPADGKVLNFGIITNRRIEQVKGFTYSLDALMGSKGSGSESERALKSAAQRSGSNQVVSEDHFANVNAIEYSLDQMLGDSPEMSADGSQMSEGERSRLLEHRNHLHGAGHTTREGNALFYTVIYLAPGDYHRFHSPTNWTVEKRRHCVGELFSVSPAMVKMLGNLFVLNERVVLLGNWQHGFFSMIPVGATNVGSIKINFDGKVKTNVAKRKSPVPIGTCIETSYANLTTPLTTASGALITPTKKGIPLNVGEEVGGFRLGSTVVVLFEAPADTFRFTIREGQKIKLGESIGTI